MNLKSDDLCVSLGRVQGIKIWEHKTFPDNRGRLSKVYALDIPNLGGVAFETFEHFFTYSHINVFRGMHLQAGAHPTSKIISLVSGKATDFLLDIRRDSSTFGNLYIEELEDSNPKSIFIPVGVAHGYISMSESTIISYRQERAFCASCDSGISSNLISDYLPFALSDLVLSDRDANLSSSVENAILGLPHS